MPEIVVDTREDVITDKPEPDEGSSSEIDHRTRLIRDIHSLLESDPDLPYIGLAGEYYAGKLPPGEAEHYITMRWRHRLSLYGYTVSKPINIPPPETPVTSNISE